MLEVYAVLESSNPTLAWWEWLAGALWMMLAGVLGVLMRRYSLDRSETKQAIDLIEEQMATKDEIRRLDAIVLGAVRQSEYEQNRRETREDMNAVHRKIETAATALDVKLDGVSRDLRTQIADSQKTIMTAIIDLRKK